MEYYIIGEFSQLINKNILSCKLQGKRANKAKKLIKELKAND